MNVEGTSKRERRCGCAVVETVKSLTGSGAERAAVTTAGLWEMAQSAQCVCAVSCGANSWCRWMASTNPRLAISRARDPATHNRHQPLSNWRAIPINTSRKCT